RDLLVLGLSHRSSASQLLTAARQPCAISRARGRLIPLRPSSPILELTRPGTAPHAARPTVATTTGSSLVRSWMVTGGLPGRAAFLPGYRVEPGDVAELREISVGGDHGQAVLAGQRGQVRVRDQVPGRPDVADDLAEQLAVAEAWRGNPGGGPGQPFLGPLPGLGGRRRGRVHPRVGDQAHIREDARPRQPDIARSPGELPVQPAPRYVMLTSPGVGRVDQDVGVDHVYQPNASPSAAARASATLSMSPMSRRPSGSGRVVTATGPTCSCSSATARPRRTASFSASLNVIPRSARRWPRRMARSSSRVTAVLTHQIIPRMMP